MAVKGTLWSLAEVQCSQEIWGDESIQEKLDATHKILGKIQDIFLYM